MLTDFHTHTFLSDGALLPIELIRRAAVGGHDAIAITDHVSASNMEPVIEMVRRDGEIGEREWGIRVIAGVELTHVPPSQIAPLAEWARSLGAEMVVCHGETIVEPVDPGTNAAAVACPHVDLIAHPGLITIEHARQAAANGIFLELSARKGHCLTNGHVARAAIEAGAKLLVNSDGHEPRDMLSAELAERIAIGAGLSPELLSQVREANPQALLDRVLARRETQR
jgi:putative hydrolase